MKDFHSFGLKDHFLSFEMDLPEGALLHNAYLQLMLWSDSKTQPFVDISIEVVGTSKFVQQSKSRMVPKKTTLELDSGHVWVSPNVADMLQQYVHTKRVIIALSAQMDQTSGRFGFLSKHLHSNRCVAPTLFVSYQE
jgi:hypothetical protein